MADSNTSWDNKPEPNVWDDDRSVAPRWGDNETSARVTEKVVEQEVTDPYGRKAIAKVTIVVKKRASEPTTEEE